MSSSAPTKDCPRCNAALATGITQCACGYLFAGADVLDAGMDLVTQAEVLYETHLRARLHRAVRITRVAKIDLLRDPTNVAKKGQLREMEKEVMLLGKQLDLQGTRITEARTAAVQLQADHPVAPEAFRAVQGAKAEQSFELNRLQTAIEEMRVSQATGAFNVAQAEKARDVVQQTAGTRSCPRCNATVNVSIPRCQCGYELRAGTKDGKEFISADELTALRGTNP